MRRLTLVRSSITQWMIILITMTASVSFGAAKVEPLTTEQAFQAQLSIKDQHLNVRLTMADGYYLYKDRIKFTGLPEQNPLNAQYPPATMKRNADGKLIPIYDHSVDIPLTINPQSVESVVVDYQGCSAQGFCYPPVHQSFSIQAIIPADDAVKLASSNQARDPSQNFLTLLTDQQGIQSILQSKGYAFITLLFLGLGLLLAFTPCVLPMVPILTGIIVGQTEITTRKAFFLSLTYVIGSSLTYALAGVGAAYMGNSLQAWLQKPLVIGSVSFIFFMLALSLFGLFEIRLPSRMQTRMTNMSNTMQEGTYIGVFGMGALSTLIVSPCVTAPLVGVLLYIGQTGNLFLGALALFAIGFGMGIPLLLIGTTAGKWLPKAGGWMESIKKIFGIIMLMMAVWLLSRVLTTYIADILWKFCVISILITLGGYLPRMLGHQRFHRGLGAIAGISGVLLFVGGVNVPNPIVRGAIQQEKADQVFQVVHNLKDLKTEMKRAALENKPVVLDFYADWCDSCVSMDKNVFAKDNVQAELSNYVLLRADLTANDEQEEALSKAFQVIAPPTVLFFDSKGQERDTQRIVGEVDAKEFLARVNNNAEGTLK